MATPTNLPATVTTGQVLTAAYVNDLRGAFRVLQVVHGQSTTQVISSSSTFIGTSCSFSITPQSTTSKILVLVSIPILASAAYCGIGMRLVRNSTVVWSTIASNYFGTDMGNMSTIFYLDSPSSTSSTTYSVEFNRSSGTGNAYVHLASSPGNMVLMEVSA